MLQGSKMTKNRPGMRNGLSLVEMLIAIILFGVISSIGYKYYKNFYDTSLAAKKATVSALIDQATQLSNAYDIYQIQKGTVPAAITDLSGATVKIITEVPDPILVMTDAANGWEIASVDVDGAGANDIVLGYQLTGSASNADKLDYCNVLNNIANSSYSLNTVDGDVGTAATMYDGTNASGLAFKDFMCYRTAANTYLFAFVKTIQ